MFKTIINFFRTGPNAVPLTDEVEIKRRYRKSRISVFLSITLGYAMYYVVRQGFAVVKKPLLQAGLFDPLQIGTIGSVMEPPTMPRKALQSGTGGTVVARATIKGGKVVEVEIRSSNPRGLFDAAVKDAMMQYACTGDHVADQEFVFKVD